MSVLLVDEVDGVRTLTLNRPQRRNALTPELQDALIVALDDAANSATTRVVVLTGAGEAFCGGLDLAELQGMQAKPAAALEADTQR